MIQAGFLCLLLPVCALAQLAAPGPSGVVMGHVHINAKDPEAQARFWTMLGATPAKQLGPNAVFKVQNALVLVRKQDNAGGSEASVVHHFGFKVKDLAGTLEKCKAAGIRIITAPEVTAKSHKANVMGPDDLNVELVEDTSMSAPIASHHIHWYNTNIEETRAWYVKTFGAVAGKRDQFEAADLPGINLSFSMAKATPEGTKGRALDHIGFEVKDLEAFTKKLEASGVKFDRPFTRVPALGISLAFLTDPWGTYIELTEGLSNW